MALNDKAVVTAAQGYVFTAPAGTAAPTPAELDAIDPEVFGAQVLTLALTGTPADVTLTVGTDSTDALPTTATPDQIQAALEALPGVGAGNLKVVGGTSLEAPGIDIAVIGTKQGQALEIESDDVTVTVKTPVNGWNNIGHTSRDDMPEFGFDGGDTEVCSCYLSTSLLYMVTST